MWKMYSKQLLLFGLAIALVLTPGCKFTIYGPGVKGDSSRDAGASDLPSLGDTAPDGPGVDRPQPDVGLDLGPDMAVPDLPVPDLPPPDQIIPDQPLPPDYGAIAGVWVSINKGAQTTYGHATIKPGGSVSLAGVVSCPAVFGCTYSWDLGNGKKSTAKSPGAVVYSTVGLYHVTFTVRDKNNTVLGQAKADVTVWTGKHTDSFQRTTVDWDKYLWLKPLNSAAVFSIKSNRLLVTHNVGAPGSTAIRSTPLVKDVRVDVTIIRSQITTVVHYCDVILRMHPQKLAGSYYRVRVKEGVAAYGHELDLTIFKIVSAADEHGINLTPVPPVITNFDAARKKNMRIRIDLVNDKSGVPVFNVTMVEAANPTKILLQIKNLKDTTTAPHTYAGFTGLTQFKGQTYFDDFAVQELAP